MAAPDEPVEPAPATSRWSRRDAPQPDAASVNVADAGDAGDETAEMVRPYTWTGGRTASNYELAIEALVSTAPLDPLHPDGPRTVEHRLISELCSEPLSVAEVAAMLAVPLGVARVLLGDMAELGLVVVHDTAGAGATPDVSTMERVLSGLRKL